MTSSESAGMKKRARISDATSAGEFVKLVFAEVEDAGIVVDRVDVTTINHELVTSVLYEFGVKWTLYVAQMKGADKAFVEYWDGWRENRYWCDNIPEAVLVDIKDKLPKDERMVGYVGTCREPVF